MENEPINAIQIMWAMKMPLRFFYFFSPCFHSTFQRVQTPSAKSRCARHEPVAWASRLWLWPIRCQQATMTPAAPRQSVCHWPPCRILSSRRLPSQWQLGRQVFSQWQPGRPVRRWWSLPVVNTRCRGWWPAALPNTPVLASYAVWLS